MFQAKKGRRIPENEAKVQQMEALRPNGMMTSQAFCLFIANIILSHFYFHNPINVRNHLCLSVARGLRTAGNPVRRRIRLS